MLTTIKAKQAHEAARKAVEPEMNKFPGHEDDTIREMRAHLDAMGGIEDLNILDGYTRALRTMAQSSSLPRSSQINITAIADKYLAAYSDELEAKAARGRR